mmetsp:Transcript_46034/g.99975  ORF Transcript_46034/g.99975 Transcript_46034/m.99975 type:complete len:202 (-) Transcript_46034:581-1186(-)
MALIACVEASGLQGTFTAESPAGSSASERRRATIGSSDLFRALASTLRLRASSSGVLPAESLALRSARWSARRRQISSLPAATAEWSGVFPSSAALTTATHSDLSSSAATIAAAPSACSPNTARWSSFAASQRGSSAHRWSSIRKAAASPAEACTRILLEEKADLKLPQRCGRASVGPSLVASRRICGSCGSFVGVSVLLV